MLSRWTLSGDCAVGLLLRAVLVFEGILSPFCDICTFILPRCRFFFPLPSCPLWANSHIFVNKHTTRRRTTVIMNKCDKILEAQTQLNTTEHYKPLKKKPKTAVASQRVNELVTRSHQNNYIDDMTKKWFSQTRNPPRIPISYTITKIHKPNSVGGPISPAAKTLQKDYLFLWANRYTRLHKHRHNTLRKLYRQDKGPSRCYFSIYGWDKLVYKHSTRRA